MAVEIAFYATRTEQVSIEEEARVKGILTVIQKDDCFELSQFCDNSKQNEVKLELARDISVRFIFYDIPCPINYFTKRKRGQKEVKFWTMF